MTTPDPKVYRSTMGLCLGMRSGLDSAIVVESARRSDPARTGYVTFEWAIPILDIEQIAATLRETRKAFRTVYTVGFYGGRDDEKVFSTLSVRLNHHIDPAPHDSVAPLKILIDDLRNGRVKVKKDSLVARDAQKTFWREGVPDDTGVLIALRCAHWAAQQYRPKLTKAPRTAEEKTADMEKQRRRRMETPF